MRMAALYVPQVENTVARSQLHQDSYFYTGMHGRERGRRPCLSRSSTEVLARGQEKYNVYCTPCHSRVGNGAGMIVQRGYAQAGNFHTARLQNAPLGHFFNVITNGYGAMPDYSAQISPADRWAVVAYIKALQLSQNATQTDVASGAHVEPLGSIAESEGFTEAFANDWALPPTATHGTPNNEDYVIPVQTQGTAASGMGAAADPITALDRTPGIDRRTRGTHRNEAVTRKLPNEGLKRMASGHEQLRSGTRISRFASRTATSACHAWRASLCVGLAHSPALIGGAFGILSFLLFGWTHEGRNHILRAYLLGYMTCFGFAGGGLVMLMLQYVSGGKWGLLLRRPLEAMTRTMYLVAAMFIPIAIFWKHLYQWAMYPTAGAVAEALRNHAVTLEQALTLNAKRSMLSPGPVLIQTIVLFAILLTFVFLLNKWSLDRDADPERGTARSYDRWRVRFENLSGPGIFIYVVLLTDAVPSTGSSPLTSPGTRPSGVCSSWSGRGLPCLRWAS